MGEKKKIGVEKIAREGQNLSIFVPKYIEHTCRVGMRRESVLPVQKCISSTITFTTSLPLSLPPSIFLFHFNFALFWRCVTRGHSPEEARLRSFCMERKLEAFFFFLKEDGDHASRIETVIAAVAIVPTGPCERAATKERETEKKNGNRVTSEAIHDSEQILSKPFVKEKKKKSREAPLRGRLRGESSNISADADVEPSQKAECMERSHKKEMKIKQEEEKEKKIHESILDILGSSSFFFNYYLAARLLRSIFLICRYHYSKHKYTYKYIYRKRDIDIYLAMQKETVFFFF